MSQRGSQRGSTARQVTEQSAPSGGNPKLLLGIAAAVLVGLALIAFLATRGGGEDAVLSPAAVEVVGQPLPSMPDTGPVTNADTDPAAGMVAPTLIGSDFDGNEVRIEPDGRAKAIYFVAHWCPHCQAEVPVVQGLIEDGRQPDNLDVYAVSTAVDSTRGNYPPEVWLDKEEFSPIVLRDDSELSAYNSAGPAGFPFVIYLNADHQVVARSAGTLGAEQMQALWTTAAS